MRPDPLDVTEVSRLCRTRFADYLESILTAQVYDAAVVTRLDAAPSLSETLGHKVWLKREDLQPVFSFKVRGAYNKISRLDPEVRSRGVIAASAGNHAQGVALAAEIFGCRSVIVMPADTPDIKVDAVRRRGGEVVLHGVSFAEAYAHALTLAPKEGLTFVHPYDDPDVIAGQGTLAVELMRQHRGHLDAVFVPIGGGGLASGVALYIKRLYPQTRVIGVEPADAACMYAAIKAGERVVLDEVGRFADGASVGQAGEETFRVCRDLLDEVLRVDTDEICAAIKAVFNDTRTVLEPAGALGVAGLRQWAARYPGWTGGSLVAVTSGANMNFDRLRFVAERADIGTEREIWMCVTIPERAGAFLELSHALGGHDVSEFNYRYADHDLAHIFVGVRVRGPAEAVSVLAEIRGAGFGCEDLSHNEVAKTHIKHMVGGRSPDAQHERIYRFSFPERSGALRRFLNVLPSGVNISLFHYRSQGGDVASVLAGMQVPPRLVEHVEASLVALGFPYVDETHNPACRFFL